VILRLVSSSHIIQSFRISNRTAQPDDANAQSALTLIRECASVQDVERLRVIAWLIRAATWTILRKLRGIPVKVRKFTRPFFNSYVCRQICSTSVSTQFAFRFSLPFSLLFTENPLADMTFSYRSLFIPYNLSLSRHAFDTLLEQGRRSLLILIVHSDYIPLSTLTLQRFSHQ
jgi:hypothetical protein